MADPATIADNLIQNETQDYIKVDAGSIASDSDVSDKGDDEVSRAEVQNEMQDYIEVEVGNSFTFV